MIILDRIAEIAGHQQSNQIEKHDFSCRIIDCTTIVVVELQLRTRASRADDGHERGRKK